MCTQVCYVYPMSINANITHRNNHMKKRILLAIPLMLAINLPCMAEPTPSTASQCARAVLSPQATEQLLTLIVGPGSEDKRNSQPSVIPWLSSSRAFFAAILGLPRNSRSSAIIGVSSKAVFAALWGVLEIQCSRAHLLPRSCGVRNALRVMMVCMVLASSDLRGRLSSLGARWPKVLDNTTRFAYPAALAYLCLQSTVLGKDAMARAIKHIITRYRFKQHRL